LKNLFGKIGRGWRWRWPQRGRGSSRGAAAAAAAATATAAATAVAVAASVPVAEKKNWYCIFLNWRLSLTTLPTTALCKGIKHLPPSIAARFKPLSDWMNDHLIGRWGRLPASFPNWNPLFHPLGSYSNQLVYNVMTLFS